MVDVLELNNHAREVFRLVSFSVIGPTLQRALFPYTTLFRSAYWWFRRHYEDVTLEYSRSREERSAWRRGFRSEEHTSELQSPMYPASRLPLAKHNRSTHDGRARATHSPSRGLEALCQPGQQL